MPIRGPVSLILMLAVPASAAVVNFHGRVVLQDGSPPGRLVAILRTCQAGGDPLREANASPKTGEYYIHLYIDTFGGGYGGGYRAFENLSCYLEAAASGFTSTRVNLNDPRITSNPQLPDLVLSRVAAGALVDMTRPQAVPRAARRAWETALKLTAAQNWAGAESALRAVV